MNRLYLLTTLLIAVISPFISIEIHSVTETLATSIALKTYVTNLLDEALVVNNYSHKQISTSLSDLQWIVTIYWGGVFFFLTRYIFALVQILRLKYKLDFVTLPA